MYESRLGLNMSEMTLTWMTCSCMLDHSDSAPGPHSRHRSCLALHHHFLPHTQKLLLEIPSISLSWCISFHILKAFIISPVFSYKKDSYPLSSCVLLINISVLSSILTSPPLPPLSMHIPSPPAVAVIDVMTRGWAPSTHPCCSLACSTDMHSHAANQR